MFNRRQFLGTAAVATGALAMPSILHAKASNIIMAHAVNELHPAHMACTSFRDALNELVPGAFNIQIFPNRQLGDDKQCLESTMAGTMQACVASGVLFPLVTGIPSLDAYQLPFLVRDYDHFTKLATSEVGQKILAELDEAGLVGVATIDIGQRHFATAKKPVTKVADFAGLKTRIVAVPLHKEIWETLGTAPIGLPVGEIYAALETGLVDALEINVSSMISENFWEVAKHFTLTGHYPWHSVTVVNKDYHASLPAELQAAITEAGNRSVTATMAYTAKQDAEGRDFLKSKGVEFHTLADPEVMREKVAPLVDKWAQRSPLIAEFVAAARAS